MAVNYSEDVESYYLLEYEMSYHNWAELTKDVDLGKDVHVGCCSNCGTTFYYVVSDRPIECDNCNADVETIGEEFVSISIRCPEYVEDDDYGDDGKNNSDIYDYSGCYSLSNFTGLDLLSGGESAETIEDMVIDALDNKYKDPVDYYSTKAIIEYAKNGRQFFQFLLGSMYEHGKGVAQDRCAAILWYSEAAMNHSAEAAYRLGMINYYGHWLPADKEQAKCYFLQAALLGYCKANNALSDMFY